jgi:uncharacterized repeat protein (TIGR01451 family)
MTLLAVILSFAVFGLWTAEARAASGEVSIIRTNSSPQPSGAPTNYLINFTCSATSVETCGDDPVIKIPIDITSSIAGTPPFSDWNFTVQSVDPDLILNWSLVGGELVVELDPDRIEPGDSLSINISVAPPNGWTPDGVSWEIEPTFETSNIPEATAPTPATGSSEAEADLRVAKNTNDGGSIYVSGNRVIYNITASCNPGLNHGSLYLTDGKLVDTLPPEVIFVSATPAPSSAPTPPAPGGTVQWDFGGPGTLPPGCVAGAGGTTNYQIVAEIPSTVPDETVLANQVTFSGTPIGTTTELDTSANKNITVIDEPPVNPGEFLGKGSQGPLEIDSLGFKGTYPGHWITPIDVTPSQNPGSAEGRYTVTVSYPASRAFETDLVDPVPCLDVKTGVKYSSMAVVGDVDGSASAPLCLNPAFHPTTIRVVSASMPQAIADSWQVEFITTDGTVVPVSVTTLSGTSAYFAVPTANIGDIAAVRLPPNSSLTDRTMTLDVWGYADSSTEGGEILEDIAAASAYPVGETDPARTSRDAAELYIQPNQLQLAAFKSFGAYRASAGGTTAMNIVGGITIPPAYVLPGPAVIADLLPDGMVWSNPPGGSTVSFNLSQGLNSAGTIDGTVEYIEDYEGTGRNLIRISFDGADFPGSGYYRLTPPSNFFLMSVPQQARVFNNKVNMFASDAGRSPSPVCGTASGTDVSQPESEDPMDLDGDGVVEQNYCSFSANLVVPGLPGPSFALVKQVQGELDPGKKGPGGIADTTNGGSGEYTITWRNTGVSGGQSSVPRDSEFAVTFAGVTHTDPGVIVEYSDSYNPCRPEVYPSNPDCVNDWTATPDDLADVKALKFIATGTYNSTEEFQVRFEVDLPVGEVNTVAWNSTAGAANVGGSLLLPAEPPKVGITAPLTPVVPTLSTQVSSDDVAPSTPVSDEITIGNADDINGTLDWTLYGPVDPGDATNCDAVDWTGATVVDQGDFAITGTGTYETTETNLTDFGCYGYEVTIDSPGFDAPVTSPVGSANEMVIIRRLDPTVSTMISSARVTPGSSVSDKITIGGTEGRPGEITWSLVGPVAWNDQWTCEGIDWTGAATLDSGTIATTGDGDYDTPATAISDAGCYGYVVTIGGTEIGGSANSPAGSPNEVVLVRTEPGNLDVTKKAGRDQVPVGSQVKYTIVVSNTGAGPVPDVHLNDKPDQPMKLVSVRTSQGTCADRSSFPIDCDLGTIDAGKKVTVTVVAIPLKAGNTNNVATASTPDPEVDPKKDRERIRGIVKVRISKQASKRKVRAGSRISYTIKVTNPSSAVARNVKVCDRPPAGLHVIATRPKATLRNGAYCWTIKSVPAKGSRSVRVIARVLKGARGRITNVAWAEGQEVKTAKTRRPVRVVAVKNRGGGVTG